MLLGIYYVLAILKAGNGPGDNLQGSIHLFYNVLDLDLMIEEA